MAQQKTFKAIPCRVCKKRFVPNHNAQKICSEKCRIIRNRQHTNKYNRTNPQKHYANNRAYWRRLRLKAENLIGNKCVICGSTEKIYFHEKHGKPHRVGKGKKYNQYYIDNYKDFIPICAKHHRLIHICAKFLQNENINWEKFVEVIKMITCGASN